LNKAKIYGTKEPRNAHESSLKEVILQVITENCMEMILDLDKQNEQDAFKKFQDSRSKE
jgi:hypothetical protein